MIDVADVVKDFLVESHENLDQLDRDLLALEQDPTSRETLASIFRTIHTIKGSCGFLGFSKLQSVTHAGENLLCCLRDGSVRLTPDMTNGLLALVDAVRTMLTCIETQGHEGQDDYAELTRTLQSLQETALDQAIADIDDAAPASAATPEGQAETNGSSPRADGSIGTISDSSIRVDVGLLDKLMNRVGELVLARNQILQYTASQKDPTFISTSQRLNLITSELQEGVMKTRMQPIGNIWSKFPRLVRDLAVSCGKEVRIEMEGNDTDLDKTIVEAIKDPLTHLVRNAVDHGLESPETRRQRGKPTEGRLLLRAFHEGGQVNIEIVDDGGGINLERVKARALERGLISHEQAARMNDREISQLIFTPGFSTAPKVTNVSGRGVGMDVVKTNIERIGGTIEVQSQPGEGTTIRLKIPLTLAIIPALVITSGGDRYAIPQVSLLELVRLEGERIEKSLERLHGATVYRLRGRLLPLVFLNRELGMPDTTDNDDEPASDALCNIIVLRAGQQQFGLVVDSINDTEEIVVKPLSKQLKGVSVYAGATIMGDGQVALILDVLGIAQRANVVSESNEASMYADTSKTQESRPTQTLLIIGMGRQRRMALPISMISRLEEIPRSSIETADHREVVQYRGQILPLIRLQEALHLPPEPVDEETPLQVVVYCEEGRSVGVVVDRIVDVVEAAVDVQPCTGTEGVIGSAVIQQCVTDLIDLPAIVRRAAPHCFDTAVAC